MAVKNATVGSEIFLQNDFLSLGINAYGGLGSTKFVPTGFASDTANKKLTVGLFADLDGFGVGKESTLQDGVLRGVAIEGFNIGYKAGGKTLVHSNQMLDGLREIEGSQTTSAIKNGVQANWNGATNEKLAVDQKFTLLEDAKYIRVDVTLTNNSGGTLSDLRYMRTVDPDHGTTMATENKIVKQGGGEALVTASVNGANPYFFYADDPRAVVSTYGFINENPYEAAAYGAPQKAGYAVKADQSMNITFGLGDLGAGKSTVVTFYMGITDNMTKTLAEIDAGAGSVAPPVVTAPPVVVPPVVKPPVTTPAKEPVVVTPSPNAKDDAFTIETGKTLSGNVLSNDSDPAGRALAALLKSGPANGTLKLNADGSFAYTANKGFVGTDSFTYDASAGGKTDGATVKIVATAPALEVPGLIDSPTLQRAGTFNGSNAANEVFTATAKANSFFFDLGGNNGADRVVGFGGNDVLVTKGAINDSNNDGIIKFARGTLTLNDQKDTVVLEGVKSLRYLGDDAAGLSVYADGAVRPKGAVEGTLGDDSLTGDAKDRKINKFFFDTALGLDLGHDAIANFGARDILVTTTALGSKVAVGGQIDLTDGTLKLAGGLGEIDLSGTGGQEIGAIEFDGSVVRGDVTYFVYSTVGSAAGLATLGL
ncbi:MAG: Ig-like domain-containing protein [Sphingomonas fennica]